MPLGLFNIKWFNKNYRHYHTIIIIHCFLVGLSFLMLGFISIEYSIFYVLASFILSSVSFISGFYVIIDKKKKNLKNNSYSKNRHETSRVCLHEQLEFIKTELILNVELG